MLRTALQFMLYDKAKSIGALFGIIISIFLIGQQTGIFTFLTNAMSRLVDNTDAALWVVDSRTSNVNALAQIDMRVGRQIESLPGVAKVYPLVIGGGSAKFENGTSAGMQLIGVQAPSFRGGPTSFKYGNYADLLNENAVSIDEFDRKALGDADLGTSFEISGKKARVAAMTSGLRGFGGIYAYTTIDRARYYANVPANKASAFLVDLQPGADTAAVRNQINTLIYGVRAWTREDFSAQTKKTVLGSSGIALSTGTLIIFAVISGLVIIGLTLYSAAIDRIRDYAVLKAIGATNGYIRKLILTQALLFAVVGFAFGYTFIELFRFGISKAGAIFSFGWLLRGAFFALTLFISLTGSVFAIRRITRIEPATVFRG
jgi:putative ABC transport system permease protein